MLINRFQNLLKLNRIRVSKTRSGAMRLFRNEKTNNWPKALLKEIFRNIPDDILQFYPEHQPFYSKLSDFLELPEDRFIVTSGIDEAIKSILTLYCNPGDSFLAAAPGYTMYSVYADIFQLRMDPLLYDPNRFTEVSEILDRLSSDTKVVFISNPNQPVENYFDLESLRKIASGCAEKSVLLAIDEAYSFFGGTSAIPLTEEFDNVLVLRTFSKAFGGGGLRLGYTIGSKESILPISAFRLAHEANAITYHIGCVLLDHFDTYVTESIRNVCEGRNFFRIQCNNNGLRAWGETGNFVLVDLETSERMRKVVSGLDDRDILVKGGFPKPVSHHIMVTCGPISQMERVFEGILEILVD